MVFRGPWGLTCIFQIIKLSFPQLGIKENNVWLDNGYITLQYQYISPGTFTKIIDLTGDSLGNFSITQTVSLTQCKNSPEWHNSGQHCVYKNLKYVLWNLTYVWRKSSSWYRHTSSRMNWSAKCKTSTQCIGITLFCTVVGVDICFQIVGLSSYSPQFLPIQCHKISVQRTGLQGFPIFPK